VRHWDFDIYVTKHFRLHSGAKDLMKFGCTGINEASCVHKSIAGIKTNKLDSVKGAIFTNGQIQKDFEAVVASFKTFIVQDVSSLL
jgi:hypothetical protein